MNLDMSLFSLANANVRYVLIGSMLLGLASGVLGAFALLRQRSLLGDALAHSALPGVCLAFLLSGSKSILVLLVGASVSGVLGVLGIQFIIKNGRVKPDAAIGIILTVFFGIGIVLLTTIQRQPLGNQAGLDKFLFGQAAAMVPADLFIMSVLSVLILAVIVLFFKEFRLLAFDADYLASLGFPVGRIDLGLMALIVLAVMVGLQAVGVILIAALLITPAAGARFWTNQLTTMVILSGIFGAVSGVLGTFFSSLAPRVPTGPVMVLAATFFFVISAVFAPRRGVLAQWILHQDNKKRSANEHILRGIYELVELNPQSRSLSQRDLAHHLNLDRRNVNRFVKRCRRKGLVTKSKDQLALTTAGFQRAEQVVKTHRLWEHYLYHLAELDPDHVHRDADQVEHILSPEILTELEALMAKRGIDTKKIASLHPVEEGVRE